MLQTKRLLLRPLEIEDAVVIKELLSDREIADNANIPYFYDLFMAESWVTRRQQKTINNEEATFAIILKDTNQLLGTTSLLFKENKSSAGLGYWLGRKYWHHGYATEAVTKVLDYGLHELNLPLIYADHFVWNHASKKVLLKAGMEYKYNFKKYISKWDRFEEVVYYEIRR